MNRFRNIFAKVKMVYVLFAIGIFLAFIILCFSHKTFWDNLTDSIKKTLESTRPTEGLFDDTSGVKLVTILFGENTCIVSTAPLDYDLKINNYDNFINNNGLITFVGCSGILYAPYGGRIIINELVDNITEITILHGGDFKTVFSGGFGLGIRNGDTVQKGQPLAIILSDMQYYLSENDKIINQFDSGGEILWKD